MPASVFHVFSNAIADGTNTQIVRPSDWNSGHAVSISATAGSEVVGAFSNTNGVSFGLSGGLVTASIVTNYAGVGETVGTVAGTDLGLTVNTAGVSIAYPKWLTTARASNDAIGLNTAKTNVTWTVNSSGLSIDAGGYAGTGFTSTTTAGTQVKATHDTAGDCQWPCLHT
jgi:hypothetical protein